MLAQARAQNASGHRWSVLTALAARLPLPRAAFVRVSVRRVRDAKLVWVNWPYLRELGVVVDPGEMTIERARPLLRLCALRIPEATEPDELFCGPNVTVYADRYGGDGVGTNGGSGRAATRGELQIKGIGPTPLVDDLAPSDHRHGSLFLNEALREAVWGELNHHELPHGATRIIAVIDLGSFITLADGRKMRRGLLVRRFPVRPAHFVTNANARLTVTQIRAIQRRLRPLLEQDASGELAQTLMAFASRLSRQHATMWTRRIPHGALSCSNVELSGRVLDCETQSAVPDHGPTIATPVSHYRSDSPASIHETVRALTCCVTVFGRRRIVGDLPDNQTLDAHLRRVHGTTVLAELIGLTGVPMFALPHGGLTETTLRLAVALHRLAFHGAHATIPRSIHQKVPTHIGAYDIGALLFSLACLYSSGRRAAVDALLNGASDANVASAVEAYFQFRDEVADYAPSELRPDLDELIRRVAAVRNERRRGLALPTLLHATDKALRNYMTVGDSRILTGLVDDTIQCNRRFFLDDQETCIIRRWDHRVSGASIQYSFHRRRGYELNVVAPRNARALWFFEYEGPRDTRLGVQQRTAAVARGELTLHDDATCFKATLGRETRHIVITLRSYNVSNNMPIHLLSPLYLHGVRALGKSLTLRQRVHGPTV